MAENKLADLYMEFAIKILGLIENIKGHYSLSNQLERSGTGMGSNVREVKYAHSRHGFIAKLQLLCCYCDQWLHYSVL
ncbi:MAG: four helix bundle protein [Acutalibacteraceae bacterium]